MEEHTVENSDEEYTWIIDPLDGTTNFIHRLPAFSISVALKKRDEIIMGTVLDVKADECYYACERGSARYMNGSEIRVSVRTSLENPCSPPASLTTISAGRRNTWSVLSYLMRHTRGIRRFGSAAIDLAWVACGRFDGFWEYSLKPWDVAAGSFIVQQAGGNVSDFSGDNNFLLWKGDSMRKSRGI